MSERTTDKRLIFGGILISVGLIWILHEFNLIPYRVFREIFSLPGLSLLLGLFLLSTSRHKFLGAIFTVIGGWYLLDAYFYIPYQVERIIFPSFLVLLGIFIILRGRMRVSDEEPPDFDETSALDYIDEVSILGGGEKIVTSNNFKGGKITSIFGGSEIDFKQAKLGEGTKTIDLFVLFGGSKLVVPEDWNIKTDVTSIFGGFSDKRKVDPMVIPDPRKELTIKGLVLFGGCELKDY